MLLYMGGEFAHGIPKAIRVGGDANSLSVWHFPVIWLIASILSYCVIYAVGIIRSGKVNKRPIPFGISVVIGLLIALYWLAPMLTGLYDGLANPVATSEKTGSPTISESAVPRARADSAQPAKPAKPAPVTIHEQKDGFRPTDVRIKRGATVRFVAAGGVSMQVTSDYADFNQGVSGDEYSFTFTTAGIYKYHDTRTTSHQGTITVTD